MLKKLSKMFVTNTLTKLIDNIISVTKTFKMFVVPPFFIDG